MCFDFSSYTIVCVGAISAGIPEQIESCLDENTALEQFINVDEGTLKFLTTYKKQELRDLERRFHAEIRSSPPGDKFGKNEHI